MYKKCSEHKIARFEKNIRAFSNFVQFRAILVLDLSIDVRTESVTCCLVGLASYAGAENLVPRRFCSIMGFFIKLLITVAFLLFH